MRIVFRKITPVFLVALLGMFFLFTQFFIPENDYNIFAYLFIYIVLLSLFLLIDRYLITKIAYKKLFVVELILIIGVIFWYVYSAGYTEIKIETSRPYFFIIYDDAGLKKSSIPSTGLFKKSIQIKIDSSMHLNYTLKDKVQITPPRNWNYGYLTKGWDTVIHSNKVEIQVFSLNLSQGKVDSLLNAEIAQLLVPYQNSSISK